MSLVVTLVGSPRFRTPVAARSQIFPSLTTTTASAGKSCFLRTASTSWLVLDGGEAAGAAASERGNDKRPAASANHKAFRKLVPRIPKGFRPKAQGWEERATLGFITQSLWD